MTTAAVYARISLDRSDGEGVARQLEDCRRLAAEHGHQTLSEYVDNDVSAFRARRRPAWDRLLGDLRDGRISAVYAYHPDRLYRALGDLEAFIDAVQASGAEVRTVKAGDVDLSTASGRMIARILGSVARHESERIGERVSRAKQERALQGRPAGGGRRPAGLTADRSALVPAEATMLQEVAERLLAGSSYPAEVERITAEGHRTPAGNLWTAGTLRRTLTSPHVAGKRAWKGEIVGDATSPAILDEGTWLALKGRAAAQRRGRPPSNRFLLTGHILCGECGRAMYGNATPTSWAYRCPPGQASTGKGCGKVSIVGPPLDDHVVAEVTGWLADGAIHAAVQQLTAGADAAPDELAEIEDRLARLGALHAEGVLTDLEHHGATRTLIARRDELASRRSLPAVTGDAVAEAWEQARAAGDRPAMRSIIGLLAEPIVVRPVGRFARVPAPERVTLEPRWAGVEA